MTGVQVAGVGMTHFCKPGASPPFTDMAREAIVAALDDAGLTFADVGHVIAGYMYGDTTSGQRAVYEVGITGVPVVNVNNACATGSTALYLARRMIEAGAADVALAVGFEQMPRGAIDRSFPGWPDPWGPSLAATQAVEGPSDAPFACQLFGGAAREYMERTGCSLETLAEVQVKARRHAAANEHAMFRAPLTVREILDSAPVVGPLTRLMCCPPTCGAAAAVLCSDDFMRRRGLSGVSIRAQALVSDSPDVFTAGSPMKLVGVDMARRAADQVYEASGVDPRDIGVAELHDCFTINELLAYEAVRLAPEGGAEQFVRDGDNTHGGRCVTNPSGGLLSKGHPIGATGLAQCAELVWQLRGQAGARQVPDARLALQHNLGLAGACVVTLYERV